MVGSVSDFKLLQICITLSVRYIHPCRLLQLCCLRRMLRSDPASRGDLHELLPFLRLCISSRINMSSDPEWREAGRLILCSDFKRCFIHSVLEPRQVAADKNWGYIILAAVFSACISACKQGQHLQNGKNNKPLPSFGSQIHWRLE